MPPPAAPTLTKRPRLRYDKGGPVPYGEREPDQPATPSYPAAASAPRDLPPPTPGAYTAPPDWPQPAKPVTPQEPRLASMAPGLGTTGGGPAAAPKEVAAPPLSPKPFSTAPEVQVEESKKPFSNAPEVQVEESKKPFSNAPEVQVEQPKPEAQPSAPKQPPPQEGPIPLEQEDPQTRINNLIAAGHSPGEAQAMVRGQQASTISGAESKPKAEPQPQKQPEQPAQPAQPEQPQQPVQPADSLVAGKNNAVDPVALYRYLLGKFQNSSVLNHPPADGKFWHIKTGSAAEWAAFALAVAKQESDLNAHSTNLQDPGGSYGLFQFSQKGQSQYTNGEDQYDPQKSADAFVRAVEKLVGQKGKIANLGVTFGSILRPHEAGQYLNGADKIAAGGNGADLVSSGGGDGGYLRHHPPGDKKGVRKEDQDVTLVPMVPSEGGGQPPAQAQVPQITGGGGRAALGEPEAPPSQGDVSFGGGGSWGDVVAGAMIGGALRGSAAPAPPAKEEEEDPMVAALTKRGFTPAEALKYAQSLQTVAPASGLGPLQTQPPAAPTQALPAPQTAPSAPAKPPALPAPPSAQAQPAQLSLLQKQPEITPRKVPAIAGVSAADRQAVVQGLIGMGIKKPQAQALVAGAQGNTAQELLQNALKAHGQGAVRGVETRAPAPPPAPSAPPAKPPARPTTAAAPAPAVKPQAKPAIETEAASHNMQPLGYNAAVKLSSGEVFSGRDHARALKNAQDNAENWVSSKDPTHYGFTDKKGNFVTMDEADKILAHSQRAAAAPAELTAYTGRPAGSTHGLANPPSFSQLTPGLKLSEAVKEHAGLLSEDDPRVKKQADGMIKGEHFVAGDPIHDQLLAGLPEGHGGPQHQMLGRAEAAISEKRPMHISYLSAPKEAQKFPNRESRTVQYEEHSPEARLMGTTTGQLVGHSFIPLAVGVSLPRKTGEPHQSYIQGISTNILANNFQHLNEKLVSMGEKTPYKTLGQKFYNDLEGYYSNLNAGHTATGSGYAVGTADHPNEPDTGHVPYKLTRKEADFINTVINNTAAFAKHEDAQKLRELARANGTLITEAGETNRMRHRIEQHEPGWRGRVIEPSIRSFKTGLIVAHHASEENFPETIRPGKEYQGLTRAIQRTSERGRPDVPIAVSLHHTFADNRKINDIERNFSEHKIDEAEARKQLEALGEDPDEYRFVGGSGGLITPYEDDPEAITPEEHTQMRDNLRSQWVNGKLDAEKYRQKAAEVPLPSKPSKTALTPQPPATAEPEKEPEKTGKEAPEPETSGPKTVRKSFSPSKSSTISEVSAVAHEPAEPGEPTAAQPPAAPAKPQPKALAEPPVKPQEEPEPAEKGKAPPALGEALPAKAKTGAAPAQEKLTKPKGAADKAWMKDPANEAERQAYLEKRVTASLNRQNDHPSAIPLKVKRNEQGGVQHDPNLDPVWEQTDYDIANLPLLQKKKKALAQTADADEHEDTLGAGEHKHLNQVERRRLSAMRRTSAIKTLGDKILESYNAIKDIPEIAAGKGWYSRMREKMAKVFGEGEGGKASDDHELFAQLLGATSAKTPVRDNFIQALDAFEQYKAGKFDRHIEKYKEAYSAMQDGGHQALNQLMREQGILKEGEKEPDTPAAAMARWIDHHDIIPRKQNGAKYNSNSEQVLKVLAGKWLDDVTKAPKTPNFAGNLTGRTLQATIDVWAARYLHRLGHEFAGTKKGWRPQPAAEPGVNSLDFAFAQDAMKHAADKIGINPDDLQAILWYAEKHHWDQHGWTGAAGAEKGSFDETWDKAFPTKGKALSAAELQAHYQAEKAREDRLESLRETLAGKRALGKSQEHIEKYLSRYADPFLAEHGLGRSHLEASEPVQHFQDGGLAQGLGNFFGSLFGQGATQPAQQPTGTAQGATQPSQQPAFPQGATQPAQAPAPPPAPTGPAFTPMPQETGGAIKNPAYLKGALAGHEQDYFNAAQKYGVDPYLMMAISSYETGWGTSNAVKKYNNLSGSMTGAQGKQFMKFDNLGQSIDQFAQNLSSNLYQGKDLSDIWYHYSPFYMNPNKHVANDPDNTNRQWGGTVSNFYQRFGGQNPMYLSGNLDKKRASLDQGGEPLPYDAYD